MSRKLYDLSIPTNQYTDRTGKTRATWLNVGAVFEGDNGGKFIALKKYINFAGLPTDERNSNKDAVIISMFEPKADRL